MDDIIVQQEERPMFELRGIEKRFDAVRALNGASLHV